MCWEGLVFAECLRVKLFLQETQCYGKYVRTIPLDHFVEFLSIFSKPSVLGLRFMKQTTHFSTDLFFNYFPETAPHETRPPPTKLRLELRSAKDMVRHGWINHTSWNIRIYIVHEFTHNSGPGCPSFGVECFRTHNLQNTFCTCCAGTISLRTLDTGYIYIYI